MNILISGSRYWADYQSIYDDIKTLDPLKDVVIHGDADGADSLAKKACRKLQIAYFSVPAVWKKLGKRAGMQRNARMLELLDVDVVWAYHEDIEKSKGTKSMIRLAKEHDIQVYLTTLDDGKEV